MTAPAYTPLAVVPAKTAVVTGGDGVVADRTPSGVTGLDSGVIPGSNVNSVAFLAGSGHERRSEAGCRNLRTIRANIESTTIEGSY